MLSFPVAPGHGARVDGGWSECRPGLLPADETSNAKCEGIKSASELRLLTRLGAIGDEVLFAIAGALRFLLEFWPRRAKIQPSGIEDVRVLPGDR